jgi:hypothetical protein
MEEVEGNHRQGGRHGIAISGEGVNEGEGKKVQNQRRDGCNDVGPEKQVNEQDSKKKGSKPNNKQRCLIG